MLPIVKAPPRRHFEVRMGDLCNNRCVFCSSGFQSERGMASQINVEPVKEQLRRARAEGVTHVTFDGGEPTLQDGFFEVLQLSAELGFEEVVIFTNGVLTTPEYIDRVRALGGNFAWRFSVQGGDEASHDTTTMKPGAWVRLMAGMNHLSQAGAKITVNLCIVEQNYRSLPRFPALLEKMHVKQFHVDLMRTSTAGDRPDEYFKSIMPRFSDLRAPLGEMLAGFPEEFDVNVGNLPYCQLPEWAHRIHHGGEATGTFSSDGRFDEPPTDHKPWDKYQVYARDKIKLPACAECAFDPICTGVFAKYVEYFGGDEIQPVRLPQLAQLDAGRRFFPLLVEPWTRALIEARPPAGFTIQGSDRDLAQRLVNVSLVDASGARVSVELVPPDSRRRGYARGKDFLLAEGSQAGSAAQETVLEWAFDVLHVQAGLSRVTLAPAPQAPVDLPVPAAPRLPVLTEAEGNAIEVQRGSPHQIEIQLGHLCNDRCVFCVSGQYSQMRQAGQIPAAPVVATLDKAKADGVRKVTFLGGEPTIQDSFLDVLRHAISLGFEEIVLFTNGLRTGEPAWADAVLGMGGNLTWRFSLQGADHESHDRTVQRVGAFQKILDGLTLMTARGQRLTVNMCVVEQNFRSLPKFPALLRPFNVRQLHLDMMRPSNAGVRSDAYLKSIMPRLTDLRAPVREMLAAFPEDFDVNVGNLPYCQIPEWAHRVHHGGELTFTISADGGKANVHLSDPWNKYQTQQQDKIKPPQCKECVFDPTCNGIFQKYAQFYGTDELVPVSRDQLRALDTQMRFFVHLVEPYTQALAAAEPPAGLRATRLLRDSLQRVVRVEYGAAGAIELHPPGARRAAFAKGEHFLLASGGPDGGRQKELNDWAFGVMSAHVSLERVTPAPRPSAQSMLKQVLRVAAGLRGREVAGWRMLGVAPLPSGDGLAMRFSMSGLNATLALRVRGGTVSCEVQNAAHQVPLGGLVRALQGMVEDRPQPSDRGP